MLSWCIRGLLKALSLEPGVEETTESGTAHIREGGR